VISYEDYVAYGSEGKQRSRKFKVEGKEYIVKMEMYCTRFNV
jgi:ribosome-binding ATPase YchF (GTP1/OBG family)